MTICYALGGTGSWWRETTTGNTWGWEDGNWPQMAAIAHAILPFEFALPIVQQLEVFAEAQYIAEANVNCEFNCADVIGYLGRWLMFSTRSQTLLAGTAAYPDTVNAYDPADPRHFPCNRSGPTRRTPNAHLQPLVALQAIADYFMQDPSDNPVIVARPAGRPRNGALLGLAYLNDYNPFVTGSFLYWGSPTLYSVRPVGRPSAEFYGHTEPIHRDPAVAREIDVASGGPYPGPDAGPSVPALTRQGCRRGSITWCGVYSDTSTPVIPRDQPGEHLAKDFRRRFATRVRHREVARGLGNRRHFLVVWVSQALFRPPPRPSTRAVAPPGSRIDEERVRRNVSAYPAAGRFRWSGTSLGVADEGEDAPAAKERRAVRS